MLHLLNLLAAIALLVWGTHIVRTGMLRVLGENLRRVLAHSFSSRLRALIAGLGVTSIVQSSTATCLIVASFVGKNLVTTSAALAVMLGADVGTSVMTVVFSFDLSWLSPLLIFIGVVVYISQQNSGAGPIGRVLLGLGLITLALQLIVAATRPLTESAAVRALLVALPFVVAMLLAILSPWGGTWKGFAAVFLEGFGCTRNTLVVAAPAWLASLLWLRRLAPLEPLRVGLFSASSSLLVAALAVQMACPSCDSWHMALSHYAPVLVAAWVAALLSPLVLRPSVSALPR